MKVLFIQYQPFPYFGIMSLSGYLKKHGFECYCLVAAMEDDLLSEIRDINPDVIGFSVLSTEHRWLCEITRLIKDNFNKPIIFTEVGYDAIEGSNKEPWRVLPTLATYKENQDEQANCLESLLLVLTNRPWFKGFYWWNYFPRPDLGPLGYTLRGKKGEKVLSEWFKRLK